MDLKAKKGKVVYLQKKKERNLCKKWAKIMQTENPPFLHIFNGPSLIGQRYYHVTRWTSAAAEKGNVYSVFQDTDFVTISSNDPVIIQMAHTIMRGNFFGFQRIPNKSPNSQSNAGLLGLLRAVPTTNRGSGEQRSARPPPKHEMRVRADHSAENYIPYSFRSLFEFFMSPPSFTCHYSMKRSSELRN